MNVLFIGLGGVGQRHLRNLLEINSNVNVGAVRYTGRSFEIGADLKPKHDVDIVEKYNIQVFDSITTAAKEFNPSFAIIANPTSAHVATAMECVESGIPVFMEKPVSASWDGLEDLLTLSEEKNVPVMIGYMMRFHPAAIKLKELIDSDVLKNIYSTILTVKSYMPSWHSYENYNEFYVGRKDLGGGVVLTEIHELDLLNWYFGNPKQIFAIGGKYSSLDIDVEDTVSVLIQQTYKDNQFPINVNMSFVQKAAHRTLTIFGENGKIHWDIVTQTLIFENTHENTKQEFNYSDFQRNEMFILELKHFINSLESNAENCAPLSKVVDGHCVALAIKDSLELGKPVDFKKLPRKERV